MNPIPDKITRLEAMEYTIRQIRAMVAEGTPVEDAISSMEQEVDVLRLLLEQSLQSYVDCLKFHRENPNG